MKDLSEENKLYKKMQFRQEKALRGFEDKENDLPNILEKHNNEVRLDRIKCMWAERSEKDHNNSWACCCST